VFVVILSRVFASVIFYVCLPSSIHSFINSFICSKLWIHSESTSNLFTQMIAALYKYFTYLLAYENAQETNITYESTSYRFPFLPSFLLTYCGGIKAQNAGRVTHCE